MDPARNLQETQRLGVVTGIWYHLASSIYRDQNTKQMHPLACIPEVCLRCGGRATEKLPQAGIAWSRAGLTVRHTARAGLDLDRVFCSALIWRDPALGYIILYNMAGLQSNANGRSEMFSGQHKTSIIEKLSFC